jgi:hypothetical protein
MVALVVCDSDTELLTIIITIDDLGSWRSARSAVKSDYTTGESTPRAVAISWQRIRLVAQKLFFHEIDSMRKSQLRILEGTP